MRGSSIESAVRAAIGKAYGGLADYDAAERELRRSVRLLDGLPDERDRRDEQQLALVELLTTAERLAAARAEATALAAHAPLAADTALGLETALTELDFRAGRYDAGIAAMESQRARYLARAAQRPELLQGFLETLGEAYIVANRAQPAADVFGDLLHRQTAIYGEHDAHLVKPLTGLGQAFELQDRNAEALTVLERAVHLARQTLGDAHDLTIGAGSEVAGVYYNLHRYDDAEAEYRRLLPVLRQHYGDDYPMTRVLTTNLGVLYNDTGRSAEALPLLEQLYEVEKRLGGEMHPDTLNVAHNVAISLSHLGRREEALGWQARTWNLARTALPADDFQRGIIQHKLAEYQCHLGRTAQARANFDESIAFLRRVAGDNSECSRKAVGLRSACLGVN